MDPRYTGILCALAMGCSDSEEFGFARDGAFRVAATNPDANDAHGNVLGTAAEIFARVGSLDADVSSTFLLLSPLREAIPLTVEEFHLLGGELSMSGRARESTHSSFILKGNDRRIYGWVVLNEEGVAYEYTTDARGNVVVDEVPISKIYPVCNLRTDERWSSAHPSARTGLRASDPHIGEYDGSDLNKLQSLPGAKKVFYLKISAIMDGDTPKHFAKEEMWKTWQSVASALSMFELNVTTDPDVYAAAGVPNSGIACFLDQDGRSNAPLHSFGTTSCSSNYKNRGEGYGLGRIAAHEIGHQLGLNHDRGQPGGEYFEGFPAFKWTPLMGNIWPGDGWGDEALYQYSKGEYGTASQHEDDLDIMNGYLPFRADDIPDAKPLLFDNGTELSSEKNRGQISENTDSDTFSFRIVDAGGHATLAIDRIEYLGGAMLDVAAELQDASGNVLAESNERVARHAKFDLDLAPADYKLVIRGGAEGTPEEGFSNYSSLGFYGITGTILGADVGSGGSGGLGGAGGAGGSGGLGGAAGVGGSSGSGGVGATGGAGGLGGSAGAGGAAGTGATAGAGGVAGAGGASGSGGDGGAAGSGATGGGGAGGAAGSAGAGTGGSTTDGSVSDASQGCGFHAVGESHGSGTLVALAFGSFFTLRRRRK